MPLLVLLSSALAGTPTAFDAGSIVIPMDQTHQDDGALDAYGLVYDLLLHGIEVHWVIDSSKAWGEPDVTGVSTHRTTESSAAARPRDFAGGPFVVDASDAADAAAVISDWTAAGHAAVAYVTDAVATLEVDRTLAVAPSIAVLSDDDEDDDDNVYWDYLNAAGIPDGNGGAWDASSPGALSESEVAGTSDTSAGDGALFHADGTPAYCHLNAVQWKASDTHPVVMEIRAYAQDPLTSSLFGCTAAESIENDSVYGSLITSGSIDEIKLGRKGRDITWSMSSAAQPLLQFDGDWGTTGCSLENIDTTSTTLNPDVAYVLGDDGQDSAYVVATGRLDGDPTQGAVTLLGGHEYDASVPYSGNDELSAVRVFLNAHFASDCASASNAAAMTLGGASTADDLRVGVLLEYDNGGPGRGAHSELVLTLPPGLTYAGDDAGGASDSGAGTVTWSLDSVAAGDGGDTHTDLLAEATGTYPVTAELSWRVGATGFAATWTHDIVVFNDSDDDGLSDEDEVDIHGTDPHSADTDGGGVSDGDEIERGTDPNDPLDDLPDTSEPSDTADDTDSVGGDSVGGGGVYYGGGGCLCTARPTGTSPPGLVGGIALLGALALLRRRRGRPD